MASRKWLEILKQVRQDRVIIMSTYHQNPFKAPRVFGKAVTSRLDKLPKIVHRVPSEKLEIVKKQIMLKCWCSC